MSSKEVFISEILEIKNGTGHRPIRFQIVSEGENNEPVVKAQFPEGIDFGIVWNLCNFAADPKRIVYSMKENSSENELVMEKAELEFKRTGVSDKVAVAMMSGFDRFSIGNLLYNRRLFVVVVKRPEEQLDNPEPYVVRLTEVKK